MTVDRFGEGGHQDEWRYNLNMKFCFAACVLLSVCSARDKAAPPPEPKSVTVNAVIDHNRVVLNAESHCRAELQSAFARGWITVIPISTCRADLQQLWDSR